MGRKFWKNKDGAALVEFAIVMPILVLLLLGLMEFGLLLYNQHVITNASREGARYGIVAHTPRHAEGDIGDVVNHYCEDHLVTFGEDTPHTDVEVTSAEDGSVIPTTTAKFSDNLKVTVTFRYDFLVIPKFVSSLIATDLRAETTMKYE